MKILFVEAKAKLDVLPAIKANLKALQAYKKLAIAATVQFTEQLPAVQKFLEKNKIKTFIGKPSLHAVLPGQLLGCDPTAALSVQAADAILYIGTGEFHPGPVEIGSKVPVLKLNPFTKIITKVTAEEIRRHKLKNLARIENFKKAKRVGILVTTKLGQSEMQGRADKIREKLEKQGKEVYLFLADTFNYKDMENFPDIEAWVNTACPRITDDQQSIKKPVVNATEIA
ncbi:MAG: diphthamide synthesis protein [DPANN group archaeon]|nr:diphthamide synthesis protein [DPANN group archaeon]